MSKFSVSTFALASAMLIVAGFGCSPSSLIQGAAEKAIETGINAGLGTKGSVDVNGDSVTIRDDESGTEASYGGNVTLPSDFPADVPILDGATLAGVAVSADGAWASYTTSQTTDEIIAWYETELTAAGWTKQGTYSASGTTSMAFQKDSADIAVMVVESDGTPEGTPENLRSVTVTKSTN